MVLFSQKNFERKFTQLLAIMVFIFFLANYNYFYYFAETNSINHDTTYTTF